MNTPIKSVCDFLSSTFAWDRVDDRNNGNLEIVISTVFVLSAIVGGGLILVGF